MKILSLNPYIPHPLNSGGNLRSHHIVAALVGHHEVTFASQWRCGEQVEDWDFAKHFAERPVLVPCTSSPKPNPARERLRKAAPTAWFGRPQSVERHDFNTFWDALASLPLESYDVVQVRTFHLIPYALAIRGLYPKIRLVLDFDDVASVFKQRNIRAAKMRWISRWRFESYLDYCRIRLFENRYLKEFDSVWVCSELDRARVARWIGPERVLCIPNGVDVSAYEAITPLADSTRILFVADFRSKSNESGGLWFHNEVWPEIRRDAPEAEFWLVGRDPPEKIMALHCPEKGVRVTGGVASVQPYLQMAAVSTVPLQIGTGTRLKILEAMAAGLPVVSTTIGAEGIEAVDGRNVLLADTPTAMAHACVSLLSDPGRRKLIGDAGRRLARERYDWANIHHTIRQCYARLFDGGQIARNGNCGIRT